MADNKKQQDSDNLIDLASERRRFQQHKASKKVPYSQSQGKKAVKKTGPRWHHYLQLIVFLAFLAGMMTLCQGHF